LTGVSGAMRPPLGIVDVDLGNGVIIKAEVYMESAPPAAGEGRSDASFRDVWRKGRVAAMDEATTTIEAMARWVHGQVAQIGAVKPDRVGVEMGVKFVARSADLVAPVLGQVGAESTLLVRLEWETGPPPSAPGRRVESRPEGDDDDLAQGGSDAPDETAPSAG
jgi:hypothetical protein